VAGFLIWTDFASVTTSTEPPALSVSSSRRPETSAVVILVNPEACATRCFRVWLLRPCLPKTRLPRSSPLPIPALPGGATWTLDRARLPYRPWSSIASTPQPGTQGTQARGHNATGLTLGKIARGRPHGRMNCTAGWRVAAYSIRSRGGPKPVLFEPAVLYLRVIVRSGSSNDCLWVGL
jgi:hypothetical protein